MQTNMDLNHANASLEKLQSEYNQLKSESKESADVIAGLRDELTNAQHDADLLRKDMAKLDKELEHANALYAKSEEELKTARHKIEELQDEMDPLKEEIAKAQESFANKTADINSKLADMEKEHTLTRHDLELKASALNTIMQDLEDTKKALADNAVWFSTVEPEKLRS